MSETPGAGAVVRPRRLRIEDEPLLRGRGRFVADVLPADVAAAAFLRSPHATAEIRGIDAAAALAAPGVLAVLTAADMAGLGSLSTPLPIPGGQIKLVDWPPLAEGKTVHVGQPVAVVIAETAAQAQDAAELIDIDYAPLPAIIGLAEAVAPGAPQLWPEAPGNIALDWAGPNAGDGSNATETARLIAAAPHVVRARFPLARVAVASLEPRAATASFDAASFDNAGGEYTLRCGSQSAIAMRNQLAGVLKTKPEQLRVLSDDVGGAFGMKSGAYPEYVALLVAARRLGRPVHWSATRSESFLSDNQAREMRLDAELALDKEGKFIALTVDVLADMGAFLTGAGPLTPTINFSLCLASVYHFQRIACRIRCVFTSTVQTGPYRGAGRPEANYLIERLIEKAARVTGIDSLTLRRRNFIAPALMPYKTPLGNTYDSGDFPAVFEKAMGLADHQGFAARRAASARAGRKRGFGVACFLEHSGGAPIEGAALSFPGDGTVLLGLGSGPSGQGHRTVFSDLAAERLGLAPEQVIVQVGDSRLGVFGAGTVASRSTMVVGGAIVKAIEAVIEKGRKIAAQRLEADEADIGYRDGAFEVTGTDRRCALFEIAAQAAAQGEPLDTNLTAQTPPTYPNGCHVAEIEIDPDTGAMVIARYSSVDESGRLLNPLFAEGQVIGGLAQGLGEAVLERVAYDAESGQVLTGSFMDYGMPRADDMPQVFAQNFMTSPATTNPLGVKGIGEAGTTGALTAVTLGICDALGEAGLDLHIPLTPERIWRACRPPTDG